MLSPARLIELSGLGQKERIQVLLAEYAALRAEVVSRTALGFQVISICAVAIISIATQLSQHQDSWILYLFIVISALIVGIAVFVNTREIKRVAWRLKELEHEINSRAGEHLLVWETLAGVLTKMGLFRSFFSAMTASPRSELPPLDPKYLAKEHDDSDAGAAGGS